MHCERKKKMQKHYYDRGINLLSTLNLLVKVPPEIKAKRSLFRQIDQSIWQRQPNEIKSESLKKHSWIKRCEITKIKEYTHIKTECCSVAEEERVLSEGFLCFYLRISPNQIQRE